MLTSPTTSLPRITATAVGRLERVLAAIAILLVSIPSPVSVSISWGAIGAIALLPVVLRRSWQVRGVRLWLVLTVVALVSGWITARVSLALTDGREESSGMVLFQTALLVGLILAGLTCLWGLQVLGPRWFFILWSVGAVMAFLLTRDLTNNPWKYGLALPITALLFALTASSRWAPVVIAAPLAIGASVASSFRAWLAVVTVGVTSVALTRRRSGTRSTGALLVTASLLGVAAFLGGWLLTELAVSGWLGDWVQRRTIEQLDLGDNLILGGRAEWGAALASFASTPWGFGLGITPSVDDYFTAIRSMPLPTAWHQDVSTVAVSFSSGYVNFHSTFWTFWASYGVGGVVLTGFLLLALTRSTLSALAWNSLFGIRVLSVVVLVGAIWDVLFSPTSVPALAAATAFALFLGMDTRDSAPDVSPDSRRQ